MTTTILAVITGLFMVADWWATWEKRRPVRFVTKPAALFFLVLVALALDPFDETVRTWMVIGLVLSLLGDIFLLGTKKATFLAGLVSFLLGHVAYVVAMQQAPRSIPWTLVGLAVVLVSATVLGRRIVGGLSKVEGGSQLAPAVVAYILVISAMVVSAFGTASVWAIVGALLFYVSDGTLAWNRFLEERRFGPLAVMVTYHLGQAGLVAWLVTG